MVDYPDIVNLTRDELLQEYCKLFGRYQDLCESNESDTQKIHELKRSLDTATAAQAYLSQELEQYTNSGNKETEAKLLKTQSELQDVKKKCNNLETSLANLQQEYSELLEENSKLTNNLEESYKNRTHLPCEENGKVVDDFLAHIQKLENDNMDLLQKINGFEERSVRYTLTIAEYEKNIEILSDQITCLEENLQSKRMDLEEKMQILESTQEQLSEANAKIAMLSSATDNDERKGNSLFAEVDDQRQAMKQLLIAQKKSYVQMKKIYTESEHEIRRLKRENIAMRTEFEACSEIFCKADKIYQEKLNERLRNLLNQNDEIERKLKWTQEKLRELAVDKGVLFLDSLLSFCKKETDELKSQLHRARLQNAGLEEQLRNAQQDIARWRFESLKSRCILIDREELLSQNKINFKPRHAVEYKISEEDQNEATPRIFTSRRRSILETLVSRKSTSPSKSPIKREANSSQQIVVKDNDDVDFSGIHIKQEVNNEIADQDSSISCKNRGETLEQAVLTAETNQIIKNASMYEDKDNSIICLDDTPVLDNFASLRAKPPSPPSPMRPSQNLSKKQGPETTATPVRSILTKNDLVNTSKHVKFSSAGDTVYNLSPCADSPVSSTTNATNDVGSEKQPCTKSNIVIRRVVLSSKND